eukprot:3097202-Amphidinium_carterae.1
MHSQTADKASFDSKCCDYSEQKEHMDHASASITWDTGKQGGLLRGATNNNSKIHEGQSIKGEIDGREMHIGM